MTDWLATAAEDLVRAACLDVRAKTDEKAIQQTVEAIHALEKKIGDLRESVDDKLNQAYPNIYFNLF